MGKIRKGVSKIEGGGTHKKTTTGAGFISEIIKNQENFGVINGKKNTLGLEYE